MKYWIAAGATLAGGAALSSVMNGAEGTFSMITFGIPALLVALLVVQALSSTRPAVVAGGAGLLVAGLLVLAAFELKFVLLLALLGMLGLMVGWPVVASAACLMVVASVRSGRVRQGSRVWSRMAWTWALALAATYGFGLSHFYDDVLDLKDGGCRFTSEVGAAGYAGGHEGGQSLVPLSDTTCGADTVPGFVNPLLALLAALAVACLAGYAATRLRTARPRPSA
ncbi:hypothetical protein [Actinomadura oligospora]|uniref:hypothetical protein n=1 Tax=Actinomadura oligospora TaxID=111804 RepID=UPI00047BE2A1|nr:hypothetical protein [Actinomadura oligospora]